MALEQKIDHKCKSTPKDLENHVGSFDCNICLDFANDPIVTLCGHLYCWPCIYKWFLVQSASLSSDEFPQCPVCKAEVSHTTVIPLYGRGQSNTHTDYHESNAATSPDTIIPPRPPACGTRALLNAASQPSHRLPPFRNPYQNHEPFVHSFGEPVEFSSSATTPMFNLTGNAVINILEPVAGLLGETVYARVFGNSSSLYTYPNSYHVVQSNSSRLRRQEMRVDKSLSRVSLFLLCCFLLCLFLF